jgi:hypothetical protein
MKVKQLRNPEEALSELLRESQVRERCYDRWIADGKMTSVDAQDRFDRLNRAIEHLTTYRSQTEAAARTVTSSGDLPA